MSSAAATARTTWVEVDLADPQAPSALLDSAETLGPVRALVNCAAHSTWSGLLECRPEDFDRHIAVNARAALLLSAEFARRFRDPPGSGITVNAVNPGPNDTGWMDEETAAVRHWSPMGRIGTPDDVAGPVAFLCSDATRWITGQVLTCDGGWERLV
jgi:3-oxoacyl-[acyl-carrier protein] reductase